MLPLIVFTSCEDVVDIKVPESDARLVVEGNIMDQGAVQRVQLTYSSQYFANETAPAVSGATVMLSRSDGLVDTLQENEVNAGIYEGSRTGEIGQTYVLDIYTPEGKHYRSLPEKLLTVSDIDEISYRFDEATDPDEDDVYIIMLDAVEPPNERNYYQWKIYVNGEIQDEPGDLSFARDDFVQDYVDDVEIFSGSSIEVGDTIRVEQYSISENYYEFLNQVWTQTAFIGGIFDPPPAPIKGNIYDVDDPNDFALGFFHASSIKEAETVIKD